ncbi:MAG: 50S ribosomal protein L4 [Candidatus Bathyarchaeia archaeon]
MIALTIESIPVFNLDGVQVDSIEKPKVFSYPIHKFLIRRVVDILQTHRKQKQGRDPMAGKRTSAESLGTGYGLARVPRIKGSYRAAFVTMAVKGRSAHAPTSMKVIYKRVNKKERHLALLSAISSTGIPELVAKRGHRIEGVKYIPLVVVDDIETVNSTKAAKDVLKKLGLWSDVERVYEGSRARSGKPRRRGRVKRVGRGPLIVVYEDRGVGLAMRNIPGVDVVELRSLNPEHLAPGGYPGRLTLWSLSAFKKLDEIVGEVYTAYA